MDINQVMAGKPEPAPGNPAAQNLIGPSKVDRGILAKRPRGFYKLLILGGFGVLTAFCTGWAYERCLVAGLSLWIAIIAALCFFAGSILGIFLFRKISDRAGFVALEALAFMIPFVTAAQWRIEILALAVLFLFLLWGYAESRSELNYGTEIRFFKVTHAVTAKIVTALLLFAILFFIVVRGVGANFFVSEQNFDVFFRGGSAIFADFYPSVVVNGSFQDFSESVAEEQLADNTRFNTLTPSAQATTMQAETAALTANFSRALGVTITPSSTTSGVIYDFIATSLRNWHDRFGLWFVVGWAFALFIILRSFGVVFIVIAQFFGMIFYEALLATGIIQVVEHPQTKEEVEFT